MRILLIKKTLVLKCFLLDTPTSEHLNRSSEIDNEKLKPTDPSFKCQANVNNTLEMEIIIYTVRIQVIEYLKQ